MESKNSKVSIWRYLESNRQYGDVLFRANTLRDRKLFCQSLVSGLTEQSTWSYHPVPVGNRLVPDDAKWEVEAAALASFELEDRKVPEVVWSGHNVRIIGTKDQMNQIASKFGSVSQHEEVFMIVRMSGKRSRVGFWPE